MSIPSMNLKLRSGICVEIEKYPLPSPMDLINNFPSEYVYPPHDEAKVGQRPFEVYAIDLSRRH